MTNVPEELKWLYKEIWMWRAFGMLLTLFFMAILIGQWIEISHHTATDEVFQAKSLANQERQIAVVNKNYEEIKELRSELQDVGDNVNRKIEEYRKYSLRFANPWVRPAN